MALFSFRHSVKTFSPKCETASRVAKEGQTASHLRYITRASAARIVVRERFEYPSDSEQAAWIERAAMKRRGRACERFIVALPVEATAQQREALARRFANELTQGKAGYIIAIHDKLGNDIANPHFHLVAFDHYEKSGGRGRPRSLLGMARKNALEDKAKLWATIHNEMMTKWGFSHESNISHLSFADREIDRIPEIHEGAASRKMKKRGVSISPKPDWNHIDSGRTRAEANQVIKEINKLKWKSTNDIGLGSGNEGGSIHGDSGSPPWRTNGGRRFANHDCTSDPRPKIDGVIKVDEDDRNPPWVRGKRPTSYPTSTIYQQNPTAKPPFTADPDCRVGPYRRVRTLKRVFLELIFLRDTLRARLATLNGRRHALPNSRIADADPSKNTQKQTPEHENHKPLTRSKTEREL